MAMNLTPITKAEMMMDRLELAPGTTVKFINSNEAGYHVVHTLTLRDHWSVSAINNLYINVDFLRLLILDFGGLEDIISQTEFIQFEGVVYKPERRQRPISLNRVWEFKLEPVTDYTIEVE